MGIGPAQKPSQFMMQWAFRLESPVVAFDRLFQFHYILNLHFAIPLTTFYNFFEGLIYLVIETEKVSPQVPSLNVSLQNVWCLLTLQKLELSTGPCKPHGLERI